MYNYPDMKVEFNNTSVFHPDLINQLLLRSYANISGTTEKYHKDFQKFDNELAEHPHWVGKFVFITTVDDKPVGFVSFDPQGKPLAEIGHNCIIPENRGSGLGKGQIMYALEQIESQGFKEVAVSTCEHADFLPAQKMYIACGFKEVYRFIDNDNCNDYKKMIQYKLNFFNTDESRKSNKNENLHVLSSN